MLKPTDDAERSWWRLQMPREQPEHAGWMRPPRHTHTATCRKEADSMQVPASRPVSIQPNNLISFNLGLEGFNHSHALDGTLAAQLRPWPSDSDCCCWSHLISPLVSYSLLFPSSFSLCFVVGPCQRAHFSLANYCLRPVF